MHLFYDLHNELTRFLFPLSNSDSTRIPSPDLLEFNLSQNDRFVQFLNKQIPPAPVDLPSLIRLLNTDPKAISNAEKHLLGRYGAELGRFIKTKSTHPSLLEKEAKEIYKKIHSAIQSCLYPPKEDSDQAILLRKIDQKIEQVNKNPWNNKDASIQKLNHLKEHIHAYSQNPDTSFGTEPRTAELAERIIAQLEAQKQQKLSTVNSNALIARIEQKYDYHRQFDVNEYKKILFYCTAAYQFEENGIAHEHALKLTLIFGTARKAIEALNQFAKQNISTEGNNLDESQFVHQACLFTLPDTLPDIDDWERWKKLISEDLNDEPLLKSLTNANNIVHLYKTLEFRNKTLEPPPADLKVESDTPVLLQQIQQLNRALKKKDLKREDKTKLTTHLNYLVKCHALQSALTKPPIPFKGLDKYAILGLYFHHIETVSLSAKMLLENGLGDQAISTFYSLDKSQAGLNIPNVFIQCKDYPTYYLRKLDVANSEKDAALAAVLGKKTDCCQSLGDSGNDCAKHSLTSPNGGLYVLFKGDPNHPKPEDEVIAQSWAWIGEKGEVVFDSLEYTKKKFNAPKISVKSIVKYFYTTLALEITSKYPNITTVYVGSKGRTPTSLLRFALINVGQINSSIRPKDYQGYRDSHSQIPLTDPDIPYLPFLFDRIVEGGQRYSSQSTQMLKEILDSNTPLKSNRFIQILVQLLIQTMLWRGSSDLKPIKEMHLNLYLHYDILNDTQKKKFEDYLLLNYEFTKYFRRDLNENNLNEIVNIIERGPLINVKINITTPLKSISLSDADSCEYASFNATLFQLISHNTNLLLPILATLTEAEILSILNEPFEGATYDLSPIYEWIMEKKELKSVLMLLSKNGQREALKIANPKRLSFFLYACICNSLQPIFELWNKEEVLSFLKEENIHDQAFICAAAKIDSLKLLLSLYPVNTHYSTLRNVTRTDPEGKIANFFQYISYGNFSIPNIPEILMLIPEQDRLPALNQRSYNEHYQTLFAEIIAKQSLSKNTDMDYLNKFLRLFPKQDLKEVILLCKDLPPNETISDDILAILNEQEKRLDIKEDSVDQSKFVSFSPTLTPSVEDAIEQKPAGRPPSPGLL